ncbi:MAG: TrkH family potassium uptake protein [Robiginitomaculum sp.]|nr:TrkH family potassium uptake protein [Robiginitomaculum sp.]
MAFSRILLWLGYALIYYAVLMFVTGLGGFLFGELAQARMFLLVGFIIGMIGLIIAFIGQNAPTRESTRDAMLFLVAFWLLIPLATCLPYLSLPEVPTFAVAYFEAASATTTTGATTLNPDDLPRSLILWQALLQWSGGVMAATFAVVLLAALNLTGIGVHRSTLFTLKKGEIFSRLFSIGRMIMALYALVSFFCFNFLIISGTPGFEAFCLALTSISTGGLVPRSGILADYVSGFGALVLAVSCLLGAANVSVLWDVLRRHNLSALRVMFANVEHRGILAVTMILVVAGFLSTGVAHLYTVMIEAVFMVSSTGFDYHVIGIDMIPASLLIALVLIGGSALSTAGGIKIIRMLLLFRHLRTDLDRMSHPLRVKPVKFQGRTVEDKAFLSIWMYFFGYTLIFALGITALGASGLDFTHAVSASASALSNTGPLLAATNPEIAYGDMNVLSLMILTVIMLLGRIEVLAVFALLAPSFWRN